MVVGDPLAYFASVDLVIGGRERLRQYPSRLAPFRGQFHDMLTDRLLGETALALGDHAAARRHLRQAEATARQECLPLELARVLEKTAAVYQAGAVRAGDRSVSELLEESASLYQRAGNAPAATRLRDQLAVLARPTTLPAGLTGREAQVLRLVAAGLSNRQIADELTVSEKTVENHLTSAYGKIGADNRAAASAFMVRHGLA
jgi:DNA-binding NarL/FixJ family response regulator